MNKIDEKVDEIRKALEEVELTTMEYSLSDAIREGSQFTAQEYAWGTGSSACAMSAAVMAAAARGYLKL